MTAVIYMKIDFLLLQWAVVLYKYWLGDIGPNFIKEESDPKKLALLKL